MGLLHDLFFGTSPKKPEDNTSSKPEHGQQDWRMEEQKRWADRPLDDWSTTKDESKLPDEQSDPYRDASGNKIRPEVEIERTKADLSSDMKHVEVWVTIKNRSEFEVEVTRTNFMGYHGNGHFLRPGEGYETRIYAGNTPINNAYHTADVQFKIVENGDYFQADHYVKYKYEQSEHGNFYIPEAFEASTVAKDI